MATLPSLDMGIEVIMLPPQLLLFNDYCLYSVAIKHYFDQFFHGTPLNIHHDECMCYNAKQAFKVQYLGQLDIANNHWTWGFSHPEYHPTLYHTVNTIKDAAVAWEDTFFLEKRGIPCDQIVLFWLHTIACSFSYCPVVISQKKGHGNVQEYFIVNDKALLAKIDHFQKQNPVELQEHILRIWADFSSYIPLAYSPGDSLAVMCDKLEITYDRTQDHLTIPEAKIRFEAPYTQAPICYTSLPCEVSE